MGVILALVGFLPAFTFGMAGSQYNNLRQLVSDDANAVGTAFLRAAHLAEPHGSSSRRLLREYIKYRHTTSKQNLDEILTKSNKLHQQFCDEATTVTLVDRTAVVSILIQIS